MNYNLKSVESTSWRFLPHTHTHTQLGDGMEISTNLIVVIMSQDICVSNHHTVHVKLIDVICQ